MLDLTTMALVFGAIFLVELPDKTFIATLVMSTRFRPLLVWIGVGLAFLREVLDRRIRTEEQVQQLLDLPVLGSIPDIDSKVFKASAKSSKREAVKQYG